MKAKLIFLLIAGTLFLNVLYAQQVGRTDSLTKYFSKLAKSKVESDKALLEAKLFELLDSQSEDDWTIARNYFFQINKKPLSKFIAKASMLQFPKGKGVRNTNLAETVTKETNPVKKEIAYKVWVAKFPPARFNNEQTIYESAKRDVAIAYAKAGNVKKAKEYAALINSSPAKTFDVLAEVAAAFVLNGHQQEAINIYKNLITQSKKIESINSKQPVDPIYAEMGLTPPPPRYISFSRRLASIYYGQKKYEDALQQIKFAHDSSATTDIGINSVYVNTLLALNKEKEAFGIIDETVKSGQATTEMKQQLKTLYVKVNGSEEGYPEYLVKINKVLSENMRKEIAAKMINMPSHDFTLKDVYGNEVTLSSLKGKIVVLDFWATWCKPCVKSFPAMKMATEKFKDNPDVKFLFIHTWEREENATDSAKSYIVKNNYPFQVLMDLKSTEGNNKVVESYGVQGIPTKFLIDKKGNIRFKFVGFSEGDEAAVEEIATMIELAEKL